MTEGFIVPGKDDVTSLRHELILQPGDTLMVEPNEKHWFQAGPRGAVLYSFSATLRDGLDGFIDPDVQRITVVKDDE
jgi:D-lyxose ketol-isomerase